jgi:saccharopine dehydrogenase-like NADP-dependent oxidoreductase
MRTVLLGAGHIGQTIARLLSESGDYNLTLADRDARALQGRLGLHVEKTLLDSTDPRRWRHCWSAPTWSSMPCPITWR